MYKKQEEKKEVPLFGKLAEFREALNDEINKIKSSGISSIILRSGCPLESNGKGYWYRFLVEYAPTLPADTPCKLKIGNNQYNVSVVSAGDNSIIVASDSPLPDNIGYAQLENGSTVLMERLIQCIEENAGKSNPTGDHMLTLDGSVYHARRIFSYNDIKLKASNTESQSKAVHEALSNDVTYIWGPPGTGKTTVIGQIIDELYKHGRTVLVVSHTNTAVDGAIDKADQSYSASKDISSNTLYPILRLGTPARSIPERTTLDSHIKALGKDLYEQKQILEEEQRSLQVRTRELKSVIGKSMWIEHSDLEDARKGIDELNKIEIIYEELNKAIIELEQEIAAEKEANPNAVYYNALCQRRDTLQNDLATLVSQADKFNRKISNNQESIRKAKDELRKCDKYAEMKAYREREFMSEEFYNEQIKSLDRQIEENNASIVRLEDEATDVQNQINAYEQRGSIGRLFADGNAYTRNKNRVVEIEKEKQALIEVTDRIESVKAEQRSILGNLLQYEEQMQLYVPSQDKTTWERLINGYETEISECSFEIERIKKKDTEARTALDKLLPQIEEAKASYDIISDLQQQFNECDTELGELKRKKRSLQESTKAVLDKELMNCVQYFAIDRVLLDSSINDLFSELESKLEQAKTDIEGVNISEAIREKDQISVRLNELATDITDINNKLSDLERQAIMGAKILGTTLAKSYLDSTLRERTFDTVILDEASMASIPALWCASYLAENSIVIVGDFLQLPPIVMAKDSKMAKKWLGTDIFNISGMQELAKNKSTCPSNFVMLNDQFRMESDIADIANMYYGKYGGLRSQDHTVSRDDLRAEFHEWYNGEVSGDHVHLIDTESLNAWASAVPQGKTKSRLNTFSATVDVDMAFGFIENILKGLDPTKAEPFSKPKVLIVAQYKAHIKLINQLIDLGYTSRGFENNLGLIRAGTIHSFQGNEAEIVIFDLVVDDPHFSSNLSMPDNKLDDDPRKLFNVAITRAQFELFIVGDFKFLRKVAKNNALSELLDYLIDIKQLPKIDAKVFLPNIVFSKPTSSETTGNLNHSQIICRETDYFEYLKKDLHAFKKRMIIYSPFMTERRLADFLPYFADAINLGKKIIVVTKDRSERKKELASYIKCEEELTALGVDVIHKRGMHEKLVFVDSTAVWVGSLNTLSFTGETGEIMHRIGDKDITKEYEKIYDIKHIDTAIENKYELKCPLCGGEMLVKESDDGGIYWGCENKDYTRSKEKPYPIDGIFRCHCGKPYVFAMVKQPRWVCPDKKCGGYTAIREGHLKFENMVALIPKNRMKEVKAYLAEKRKEAEKEEKEKEKKKTTKSSGKRSTKKKDSSETKKKEEKPAQKSAEQMTLLDL